MASYKNHTCTGTVASVSDAVAALEELASECREVVDNAPESLQQTDRIIAFEESASALENISEPEIPEAVTDLVITYDEQRSTRKGRGESRAVRRDNALAVLAAARDAVDEWVNDRVSDIGDGAADDDDDVQAAVQFVSDIESIESDVEGCEFPGMFG